MTIKVTATFSNGETRLFRSRGGSTKPPYAVQLTLPDGHTRVQFVRTPELGLATVREMIYLILKLPTTPVSRRPVSQHIRVQLDRFKKQHNLVDDKDITAVRARLTAEFMESCNIEIVPTEIS